MPHEQEKDSWFQRNKTIIGMGVVALCLSVILPAAAALLVAAIANEALKEKKELDFLKENPGATNTEKTRQAKLSNNINNAVTSIVIGIGVGLAFSFLSPLAGAIVCAAACMAITYYYDKTNKEKHDFVQSNKDDKQHEIGVNQNIEQISSAVETGSKTRITNAHFTETHSHINTR